MNKNFKKITYFFHFLYEKITTSIAFYPTIIAIFFIELTGLILHLEGQGLTAWVSEKMPFFLIIKSWEVAQSVLTTLVGALISLMVFSFSMVMVLLNNAASNYSPRILPSLIANKFHQFVLGIYLGTITYCLLLAINLTPTLSDATVPSISILLGIFFGLSCLMVFVFFIHSISESVQVGKILESLANTTKHNLDHGIMRKLVDQPVPDTLSWIKYKSDRSGYIKSIACESMDRLCQEHLLKIKVVVQKGSFVLKKTDLFLCSKELEADLLDKLLSMFVFTENEIAGNDHTIGFKQINEIALKAMSPGINDPGTALFAINHLAILFDKKMGLKDSEAFPIKNKAGDVLPSRLWLEVTSFGELLSLNLASLRAYARHDVTVMLKMLEMLKYLIVQVTEGTNYLKIIRQEIGKIKIDAEKYLTNPNDLELITAAIQKIELEIL